MGGLFSSFGGGGGRKRRKRAEREAAKADQEQELDEDMAAEERKRNVLARGRGATILSPLTGDSTVGSTLLVGR